VSSIVVQFQCEETVFVFALVGSSIKSRSRVTVTVVRACSTWLPMTTYCRIYVASLKL